LLPELVKNPAAVTENGGHRRRSSTRSSSIAASEAEAQYGRVSHLTPSAGVVAQLRSVQEPIISPSAQHNSIAHQPTRPSHTLSLVAPLAQSHWHQGAAPPPARP
jgi:hypothetical protein